MELDRLRMFLHVVDTGTVSAAARAVHLTQPAVTRNLQLLESALATPLFERRGRALALTAAGRALVPHARGLVAAAETLARDVREVGRRRYHDVRIGTVDSVATWLFPGVVGPLAAAFPGLGVKLLTARTAELRRRLADGALDLAIVAWSGRPPEAEGGIRARAVGAYALSFWGRRDVFAALADAATDDAVRRFPLVEIEALPGQPTMIPEDAPSFARANSLASVKALVMAGFGVGALLDFMLTPDERAVLVRSPVGHDPECRLWVLGAAGWAGEREQAIEGVVAEALEATLGAAAGVTARRRGSRRSR